MRSCSSSATTTCGERSCCWPPSPGPGSCTSDGVLNLPWYRMYALETPALLLHLDVVERNLGVMAERARQLGVQLRPHAKTHKCVELGRRALAHGAVGLTVATLVEAETLARAGMGDLTWALPLDLTHLPHVKRIMDETGATVRVVVDDLAAAQALAGSWMRVWLKVGCGD